MVFFWSFLSDIGGRTGSRRFSDRSIPKDDQGWAENCARMARCEELKTLLFGSSVGLTKMLQYFDVFFSEELLYCLVYQLKVTWAQRGWPKQQQAAPRFPKWRTFMGQPCRRNRNLTWHWVHHRKLFFPQIKAVRMSKFYRNSTSSL